MPAPKDPEFRRRAVELRHFASTRLGRQKQTSGQHMWLVVGCQLGQESGWKRVTRPRPPGRRMRNSMPHTRESLEISGAQSKVASLFRVPFFRQRLSRQRTASPPVQPIVQSRC